MITRRLLARPAESSRSTESSPRDSTAKPPSLENSPRPARQPSAPRPATLRHTATLRAPPDNSPGPARQPSAREPGSTAGHGNPHQTGLFDPARASQLRQSL